MALQTAMNVSRQEMEYMLKDKSINQNHFMEFLSRISKKKAGDKKQLYLFLDNLSVHHAKSVK